LYSGAGIFEGEKGPRFVRGYDYPVPVKDGNVYGEGVKDGLTETRNTDAKIGLRHEPLLTQIY
jgi:predicted choloylglycine hydrolase